MAKVREGGVERNNTDDVRVQDYIQKKGGLKMNIKGRDKSAVIGDTNVEDGKGNAKTGFQSSTDTKLQRGEEIGFGMDQGTKRSR